MRKFLRYIISFFQRLVYNWAMQLRATMRMGSLKDAIAKADEQHAKTGRKVLLVPDGNDWHAVEKKKLKQLSAVQKKNKTAKRLVDAELVKKLEKRSPYVAN